MYSLLFLAALPGQFKDDANFPLDKQQAALEATVRLYHPGTRLFGKSYGSGVIVGRKDKVVYLLTADHNMPPGEDIKTVELSFFTKQSYPNPSVVREARIVERLPRTDLAVIEAVLPDHPGLLPLCPRDKLSQVRLLGPGNKNPIPVLAVGTDVGNRAPTIWTDQVTDVWAAKPGSPTMFYEAKTATVEGRSGGPLVDRRGYLIGICSGQRGEKKGYYLSIDEIRAALANTQYKFLNGDEKPAAK